MMHTAKVDHLLTTLDHQVVTRTDRVTMEDTMDRDHEITENLDLLITATDQEMDLEKVHVMAHETAQGMEDPTHHMTTDIITNPIIIDRITTQDQETTGDMTEEIITMATVVIILHHETIITREAITTMDIIEVEHHHQIRLLQLHHHLIQYVLSHPLVVLNQMNEASML